MSNVRGGRLLGYSGEFINVSENLTSHELAFEGKLAQNHPTIIIPTNKKGMVIYIYNSFNMSSFFSLIKIN
jgi:hypothetical protein